MVCKGICLRHKYKKVQKGFYLNGASRCQGHCGGIWLDWLGLFCPCCGMKLRKTPRNKHGKQIRANIEASRYGEELEVPVITVHVK